MLLYISCGGLISLENPSKRGRLHQGLDYIVYLRCCIVFGCSTIVFESINKCLNIFSLFCWMLKIYFCRLV